MQRLGKSVPLKRSCTGKGVVGLGLEGKANGKTGGGMGCFLGKDHWGALKAM